MSSTPHRPLVAVADDVTGATDLAGSWRSRGYRTAVILGEPHEGDAALLGQMDAVVHAVKIRSIAADEARGTARRIIEGLPAPGAAQVYDKYCSTFDSTPEGNIGPIADELADLLGARRAVVVPSMPANGRTVYQGHLFVHGQLLSESPMRHHPLTPMTDSSVVRLLQAQTTRQVGSIPLAVVRQGAEALRDALDAAQAEGVFYLVVDAIEDTDLEIINEATRDDVLVTGGSGLALGAPRRGTDPAPIRRLDGQRLILAGSASAATRGQIAHARTLYPTIALDLERVAGDSEGLAADVLAEVRRHWQEHPGRPVLVHSAAEVLGGGEATAEQSAGVETTMGLIARGAYDAGARQLLIAGGETSGAVISALGIRILELGEEVDPGVSWLEGRGPGRDGGEDVACTVLLKSGNFGGERLFEYAWEAL